MSPALVVLRKELRELLRDKRTLVMMVVVPVLLYPALMIASEQLALFGLRSLEAEPSRIGVIGSSPPELLDHLRQDEEIELVGVTGAESAIRAQVASAVAVVADEGAAGAVGNQRIVVVYDAANERSQRARAVLLRSLGGWEARVLEGRLELVGLDSAFVEPVALADSSIARPEEVGGYALGRFLPMLLIVITLLGAFYPAIDLAAGEKERGTLETLLTAPVPPSQIVAGKFLTVTLVGLTAAALNLGSMLLTFQTGLLRFGGAIEIEFSLPLAAIALIFATLVPLAVLFGALFLGIALRSRSFKEAQNALTPIYLFVLLPALLPLFPGIDLTVALALVPVAGVALLFRELMSGTIPWTEGALALGSTVVWAALALRFAAASFGKESVLFGVGSGSEAVSGQGGGLRERLERAGLRTSEGLPSPVATTGFMLVVAALFFYLGVSLQAAFGEPGILYSEWLLLFVPAIVFAAVARLDWRRTFSLGMPRRWDWLGALLVISGGFPLAWLVAWLQGFVLPIPFELLERMSEFLITADTGRVLWLLLLIAVTPAFCEEAVFRGVLLAGTRERLSPVRLILVNAAVFGAFHLSFETAFRFLPTAWLGILLATVVWRTGSIWPGVLMHFLNNGTVVILAASPALQETLSDWEAAPPIILLAPAAALLAAGLWILFRDRDPEPLRTPPRAATATAT